MSDSHLRDKNHSSTSERKSVVRPERILNNEKYLCLKIENQDFELCDYSAFGVSVYSKRPFKIVFQDKTNFGCTLYFDNVELQSTDLQFVYETRLNDELYKLAFEVRHAPLNVDLITSALEGLQAFAEVKTLFEASQTILPEIKLVVSDCYTFLSKLKESLTALESQWEHLPPGERSSRELGAATIVSAKFADTIIAIFDSANRLLLNLNSDESRENHICYIRENLGGLLLRAPFAHRSFYKPSGYAGDFEMMNQLYRNQIEGKDLFSKCLHRFYVDQAAAKAVQNRSLYLLHKINQVIEKCEGKPIRMLSLACGPAFEIAKMLETINPNVEIEIALLDQDVRALQNAQRNIREVLIRRDLKNVVIDYRIQSVKHVLTRGVKDERGFDFMYSSGLFDYLVDDVAIATMKRLFAALKPNCQLLIGNFSTTNPNRIMMEICLDWNLIHRTEKEMEALGRAVTENIHVESEDLGVNLFVILKK